MFTLGFLTVNEFDTISLPTSRDLRLGDISGDDAAIVRLDRTVRDFADRVSDHVPLVFRMIFRDTPVPVPQPGPGDDGTVVVEIPDEGRDTF